VKAAIKTERGLERGQPCPRVESERAIRADKAVQRKWTPINQNG